MDAARATTESTNMLSLEAINSAPDLPEAVVYVPEWGGSVRLRALSHGEVMDCEEKATVDGLINFERRAIFMLSLSLVEPQVTLQEAETLRRKSMKALRRVTRKMEELTGLTETVDELENSFRS